MTRYYYVTWDEYWNKTCHQFYAFAIGKSIKDVKENFCFREENERRRLGKPHMFHTTISISRPMDIANRTRGHLYY